MSTDAAVCAKCGTPSPFLAPPGAVMVCRDNSPGELADLIAALTEPPVLRCAACQAPLPVRPTVIGLFTAPDDGRPERVLQLVVPGTFEPSSDEYEMIAREYLYIDWFLMPTPLGYDVHELTVTTTRAVTNPMAEVATIVQRRIAASETLLADVGKSWRELTGPVLAAAELSGVPEEQLATAEVEIWRRLLEHWAGADIRHLRHLLDTDIGLYVRAAPAASALDALNAMEPPEEDTGLYAFHALRAFVCLRRRVPNPRAADWAAVYLMHQHMVRRHPGARLFAVSPARAAATIEVEAVRTAVVGILHEEFTRGGDVDTELVETLRQTVDDLGHGGLVDALLSQLFRAGSVPEARDPQNLVLFEAGRLAEETARLEAALPDADDDTVMLLAGAYDQAGSVDRALAVVEDLHRRRPGYFEQFEAAFARTALLSNNGRHAEALAALERTAPLAYTATARALVSASRGLTLHDLGRDDDALTVLTGISLDDAEPGDVHWWLFIRVLTRAWRNLIVAGAADPETHRDLLDRIDAVLGEVAASEALGLRAQLAEARGRAATSLYSIADADRRARGAARDPREVIELARSAYQDGHTAGRAPLQAVAASIAARIGELGDPLVAALQLRPLAARLTEVAGAVWAYAGREEAVEPLATLLTVGELQRDTVHRIRTAASGATSGSAGVLPDLSLAALSRLARPEGSFAVVTWFELGLGRDGTRFPHIAQPVMIVVRPDGELGLWVPAPDEVPRGLRHTVHRVRSRLANWHDGRTGDPLDLPGWQEAAAWIQEFLVLAGSGSGPRPHVVFMEHPEMPGAPWHTTIGPGWTASYVSSWSELFDIVSRPPAPAGNSIGIVHVPRFNEPEAVRDALAASVGHTLRRHGGERVVRHRAPPECDRDWLLELLRDTDIVKILCHGYVSPEENEVCLMLAHAGTLPMAGSLAAHSRGRPHRFGWRECRDLTGSHATIFSAACSSRAAVSTAAGDRLGIFAALRRSGVRALVAPAWDVQAGPTAALLDHTIDLYASGMPLAGAVRAAGDAAEASGLTPWIARSLSIEGDWR
ncbi:hypothetical protein GCM10010168_70780 [Actinoplanes ianthinogenes]|uniref:CHAT domain-containing protein n=1 Tax=Actinoplanes ianthinogenes TaxID=122358 RepID=A0ABM7M6P6_9ACTN|nr:tetratricopeptide repeat protein [Actinoplanes ianthinogenes]BCJ47333.1 hypothetical protein Aiant_79900 [Actinoplanes ianthinogenes]GGR41965.1 hypothetical protein GCM10010168_70780 [Actinoplanes ianthinogenes]